MDRIYGKCFTPIYQINPTNPCLRQAGQFRQFMIFKKYKKECGWRQPLIVKVTGYIIILPAKRVVNLFYQKLLISDIPINRKLSFANSYVEEDSR